MGKEKEMSRERAEGEGGSAAPVTPRVTGNTDELKSSLWENWKVDKGEI